MVKQLLALSFLFPFSVVWGGKSLSNQQINREVLPPVPVTASENPGDMGIPSKTEAGREAEFTPLSEDQSNGPSYLIWTGEGGNSWDNETANWSDPDGTACAWIPGKTALFPNGGTISVAEGGIDVKQLVIASDSTPTVFTGGEIRWTDEASLIATNRAPCTFTNPLAGSSGLSITHGRTISYDQWLTREEKLIFPGVSLSDLSLLEAHVNGNGIKPKGNKMVPCHDLMISNNVRSVQFQFYEWPYTKCVKVHLIGREDGVYAKVLYAGYCQDPGKNSLIGFDFDRDSRAWVNITVAEPPAYAGYGIKELVAHYTPGHLTFEGPLSFAGPLQLLSGEITLHRLFPHTEPIGWPIENHGTVRLRGEGWQKFSGPITGGGRLILQGEREMSTCFYPNRLTRSPAVVATNVSLRALCAVVGRGKGRALNRNGAPFSPQFFTRPDPDTVEIHQQYADILMYGQRGKLYTKSLVLRLKQVGSDITAQVVSAYYNEGYCIGKTATVREATVEESEEGHGYGIEDLALYFNGGAFSFHNQVKLDGGVLAKENVFFDFFARDTLCDSCPLVVDGKSYFLLLVKYGQSGTKIPVTVRGGSTIVFGTAHSYHEYATSRELLLERSTLSIPFGMDRNDSENYLNDLDITNGGLVDGTILRMGHKQNARLRVSGKGAVELRTGILSFGKSSNTISLEVNKVSGPNEPDLLISGGLRNGDATPNPIEKTGEGTLLFTGTPFYSGDFRIKQGILRFGNHTGETPATTLILNGGSLALGSSTNTLGTLVLEGDGGTLIPENGTVHFAGETKERAWSPSALLTIRGQLNRKAIRFGLDNTALTAQQLAQIKMEGRDVRFTLSPEGYLLPPSEATLLILR